MKKFLIHITLFFLPILLGGILLDWILSSSLSNSKLGEYGVWNDIFEGNAEAKIVIHGSSRAWVHIDPEIIGEELKTPAYNLGVDGHNFKMQKLRHQLFAEEYGQPDLIIYEVDVFTLAQRDDLFNSEQFLPYLFSNEPIRSVTSTYEGFDIYDYNLPLVRYYGKTETLKHSLNIMLNPESNVVDRNRGYKGQDRTWNDDLRSAKKKFNQITVDQDSIAEDDFNSFLKDCRDQNIKVVLVYPPEFIEGQDFVQNRSEIIHKFQEISSENEMIFLDYSNHELSSDSLYFYNAGHLNLNGSQLFSRTLAEDLRNL